MTNSNNARLSTTQKSFAKIPRRRVTVSGPCTQRPTLPRPERRPSLPIFKQVQFSQTSEVCVLDRQDVTTTNDWYSLQDQARFKKERICDLLSMRGIPAEKALIQLGCPVGLEQFLSSKGRQQSRDSRKMVIQAVLTEQNRQRTIGVVDHDRLALLAFGYTAEELAKAMKRGKFQEMARYID
ncbi:hypothetical protein HJC23_010531 [Cyclotella cryptica]|uniref:Uncharacterized protein n=1 Tax=Cyclotella cryptica TaxID=29204 RepID=A0ABD3QAL3_9STRA|eukprot:CCRYP_007101-RA/>CCRYP_007101-RA protein AED:0.40 eAED:0.40 QI:391/1/1/1/0/0/2/139/181